MGSGGGYSAAAAIAARVAQFLLKWAGDIILAGILLDTGRDIAEKAKDEYRFATDKIVELNQCREELACAIQNHNLTVTLPFQRSVMDTALNAGVPAPNYGGLCAFYQNLAIRSLVGAKNASSEYSSLFCVKPSSLRREVEYYSGISGVDSSYARTRSQERRQELMRESKTRFVQSAHGATFTSPLPSFGLLETATDVYTQMQNNAAGALGGSIAALSRGATQLTTTLNDAFRDTTGERSGSENDGSQTKGGDT